MMKWKLDQCEPMRAGVNFSPSLTLSRTENLLTLIFLMVIMFLSFVFLAQQKNNTSTLSKGKL